MPEFDAVIIGSGPNGLSAAVALAQRQWKVLVIEAADTPGGGTRTKELTLPGFHHDVCSAVHPTGIASPFFQTLNLHEHGLRWCHPEVPLAHPLSDGRAAVLHRSVEATAQGLGSDAARYTMMFDDLVQRSTELYADIYTPPPVRLWPRSPLLMARFGIPAMLPASLLSSAFRTDEARALFMGNAAHSILPLNHAGTSAIALMLQMSAHAVGWPVAEGGSQAIANALISKLRSLGGEVRCGWNVQTLDELPSSRAVLFDTSPAVMLRIAGRQLGGLYAQRLTSFRHGPGVFKMDFALSEPVPWLNADCRRAGTVHVGGTREEIELSEQTMYEGQVSERPFVLVGQQSLCDAKRAPAGKHTLWAYCHAPAASSVDMSAALIAQIERFAPGFRDTILASHSFTSAQMEGYNQNYIGGDIVGGMASWDQMLTRPIVSLNPYATPNPRLWLCSQSTPPAGGVHGMCGWNAAQAVLKRFG